MGVGGGWWGGFFMGGGFLYIWEFDRGGGFVRAFHFICGVEY